MRAIVLSLLLVALHSPSLLSQFANHVVIAEVYGGGGNSGAIWKYDFIELYNPTNTIVSLNGWSVQYASAAGAFTQKTILSGTIQPRSFYLIQQAKGSGGTLDLPVPDAIGTIAMSATAGKVALVADTATITGPTDASVVDFVGYGGTANRFEGSGPAPAPSNTSSIERKASSSSTESSLAPGGAEELLGNGWDTNDNASDLVPQKSINPQNSAGPPEPRGAAPAGTGSASFRPAVLRADTGMTVTVVIIGETPGPIARIRIVVPALFLWSRSASDVLIEGNSGTGIAVAGDTVDVTGTGLKAGDSIAVSLLRLAAPDTTVRVRFHIETGGGGESIAPVSAQPALLIFGSARPVADVRVNDDAGVPRLLDALVTVRGTVTVSSQFGGPAFLQDLSGAIAVFDNAFHGAVRIGDEVTVTGRVAQFFGLTELQDVTLHGIHSRGNEVQPAEVTAAQVVRDGTDGIEHYEGLLVRLRRVRVVDDRFQPIEAWGESGSNATLKLIDDTDTVTVRIDAGTDIAGMQAPRTEFDIVGVVSQYKPRPPFIGGYQLQPRFRSDIIASGPVITDPPVESHITPTSLRLNWETQRPGSSFLRVGRTKTYEMGIVGVEGARKVHSVELTGLIPATCYHVQVFSVDGSDTSSSADRVVSTASAGSTGQINVYFNRSVDSSVARHETARGNVDLRERLIERIRDARNSIDCALYSLSGEVGKAIAEELMEAKHRGVSVRLIIEKDNLDAGTGQTVQNLIAPSGIPWIADNFDAVNSGRGLQHNKFFVFDYRGGTADRTWVWTGSWNPTDSGTRDDAQNAIEIQDQALAGAYTLEFNEMWGSDSDTPDAKASRFGARKADNTPHLFNINGTTVECYFSPSDRTTKKVVRALERAEHSVNLALLTFTRTDLASVLAARRRSGVTIRGVLDNATDTGSKFDFLKGAGVDLHLDPSRSYLHHKYAIVDSELSPDCGAQVVITGSQNWTDAGENANNENTLILRSSSVASAYLQEFLARYREAGGTDDIVVRVETEREKKPERFSLSRNFPNPFNARTVLEVFVPRAASTRVSVHDVLGREVAVLLNRPLHPGVYRIEWDARSCATGVYLCRLKAEEVVETRKLLLLR